MLSNPKNKPTKEVTFHGYIPAKVFWPNDEQMKDRRIFIGVNQEGKTIRSSLVVAIHHVARVIETENTMYKVIAEEGEAKAFE